MPAHILVCEQDEAVRTLMHTVLSEAGYEVTTWDQRPGVETLVLEVQPDLIEISLWLGEPYAGLEAIEALQQHPQTSKTPLLICSGDIPTLQAHAETWRERGYGVLAKPFKLDEFLAVVRSLLDGSPQRGPDD